MKTNEWLQRFNTPIDLNKIEFLPLITLLKDAKTIIERQQTVIDKQQDVVDAAKKIPVFYQPLVDALKRLEDKP